MKLIDISAAVVEPATITFVDVRQRFNFKRIAIGRWVTQPEQCKAASAFYNALVDLMMALQCPETVISLRGSLSFQYGIGGRPGVAAHYDPSQRCFALAKNAGPGSIAHEWFHAFDHYLADKVFSDITQVSATSMFASNAWLSDATPIPHSLNDKLYQCFKSIMLSADGKQPSALFKVSSQIDRKLNSNYYARPEEMCARAFEAFIADSIPNNAFLVTGTLTSEEAKLGLYPQREQRQLINHAFNDYFSLLGLALS
ncbi:MAG: CLCA_X family protein [Oceanospirillaceae bacterium]